MASSAQMAWLKHLGDIHTDHILRFNIFASALVL